MSSELLHAIEQIGREKGIDTDVIISAVEDAIVAASRKFYKTHEDLHSKFDRGSGELMVFSRKRIVETVEDYDTEITLDQARKLDPAAELDGSLDIYKPIEALGRIPAQAAKQVIYQKVREAERENVYRDYHGRVGEIINGIVKRVERGDIIIDLGRTEGVLPRREQSRSEYYSQGDRIRAMLVDVDKAARGPQVILSRTDPQLLVKLFEMEVPEIYDGTVVIESVARDAGDRSKVAVRSNDKEVDPVGACVGMKGSRVQSIIRDLRGEKIDIVQWSPDTSQLVTNALNPAKVNRVGIVDEEEKLLEVVVDDDQLSLAIGKKGQNVRLASRLVGWRIDIKSEAEKRQEAEAEMERLALGTSQLVQVAGIGEKTAQLLFDRGYATFGDIAGATVELLAEIPGLGDKVAEKAIEDATRKHEEVMEAEAAAAEAAAAEAAAEAEVAASVEAAEPVSEFDAALEADLESSAAALESEASAEAAATVEVAESTESEDAEAVSDEIERNQDQDSQ